jgi:hypothetical protein
MIRIECPWFDSHKSKTFFIFLYVFSTDRRGGHARRRQSPSRTQIHDFAKFDTRRRDFRPQKDPVSGFGRLSWVRMCSFFRFLISV